MYLKEHYHQPSDEASLPRDAASAALVVRFISEITRQIANATDAPQWNQGDFFGETFCSKTAAGK